MLQQSNAIKLNTMYEKLLEHYGPQCWWPADTNFEVIAGAILTQSTAWENAHKAINNLKCRNCLSVKAICEINNEQLAYIIRPSGYFNSKAKKLKAVTSWLHKTCNGRIEELASINTASLRVQLLNIYGVGPETADSILLYALNRPVFVIDAYTRRIIDRQGLTPGWGTGYNDYQKLFIQNIEANTAIYNEFHALLVKLGKSACRKSPWCLICPIFSSSCEAK